MEIVLLVLGPEENWRGEEKSPVIERMKWYNVFMHQLRKYVPNIPVLVVNNFKNEPTPKYDNVTFISGSNYTEHSPALDIGIRYLLNHTDYDNVIFMDADTIVFGHEWYDQGIDAIRLYKCVGYHVHKVWYSEIYAEHWPNLMFWNLEYIRDKSMEASKRLIGPEYDKIHQDLIIFRDILDNPKTTEEDKQKQLNHYKISYDTAQRSIVLAKVDNVFHHIKDPKAHDFIHLTRARTYAPDHPTTLRNAKLGWLASTLHVPPKEYGEQYVALIEELYPNA